jgi:hypothetical protein
MKTTNHVHNFSYSEARFGRRGMTTPYKVVASYLRQLQIDFRRERVHLLVQQCILRSSGP